MREWIVLSFDELHRAIRGRRLLTTVGVFRGLAEPAGVDELLDDPESRPCPLCGAAWMTVTAVWHQLDGRYLVRPAPPRVRGGPA